jgi:hypothetical protein
MALSDLLSSLLSGSQSPSSNLLMGQTANAVAPGQATGPGAQASMPISELLASASQRETPTQTMNPDGSVNVQGVTVQPKMGTSGPVDPTQPISASAPSANLVQGQQDQQLTSNPNFTPQTNPYDNSDAVKQVGDAVQADQPRPGGNTRMHGLFGLLPDNLQHGTLRDVLGYLGDAVGGGGPNANYQHSQERLQIGNAMAGIDYNDPASVQQGIARVAATGAPESIDTADQMQKNFNEVALRKATLENTQWYRDNLVNEKQNSTLDTMWKSVAPNIDQIKNPQEYAAMYARLNSLAQRVNPALDATKAWGVIPPDQWHPGMKQSTGLTSGQAQVSADKSAGRATSTLNATIAARSRVQAAGISGGAHEAAASTEADAQEQDSMTNYMRGLATRLDNGETLPAADQQMWDRFNTIPRTGRVPQRINPPRPSAPRAAPTAGSHPQSQVVSGPGGNGITPQQAARLPRGTSFRTTDGRVLVRQ